MSDDLLAEIEKATERVVVGGVYYHYQDPEKHYRVLNIGIDEASHKPVVIYHPLYIKNNLIWIRAVDIWCEIVNHNDLQVPRFSLVS